MFRLMRFYSISSFVGFVVTAVLLAVFVRQLVVGDIVKLAQTNTLTIANSMLNSVRPELIDFVTRVQDALPNQPVDTELPPRLATAIVNLMRDGMAARVKIYNRQGTVVFSTRPTQIGDPQEDNPGFTSAMQGRILSTVVYRDTFNVFDKEDEEDNLMQVYVPLQADPTRPIAGVLEIYTDITPLVLLNERTEFGVLALVGLLLGLLYAVLILIMRHATRIIDAQQNTIRERTATLEMLSAQILKRGEIEKKRIAYDLHEGLAQTLGAIKVFIESTREGDPQGKAESIEKILPALQDAINEVQSIATGLRPSSLDGLGLLPTIRWYCREFEQAHPDTQVEHDIALEESDVPAHLKTVLYRVVESAMSKPLCHADAQRVRLELHRVAQSVVLSIDSSPREPAYAAAAVEAPDASLRSQFTEASERAALSGGSCSISRNAAGGVSLRCTWAAGHREP